MFTLFIVQYRTNTESYIKQMYNIGNYYKANALVNATCLEINTFQGDPGNLHVLLSC